MGTWKKIKLGIACQISKGQQLNKTDLEKEGDFPCINGGIEPSGYTNIWNTDANTITISEGGNSCGYVNFLTTRFWSGGHCYSLLNLKENIDVNFLYQALKGRESLIMGLRVGSGLPNIQQKSIKEFELDYPEDKREQTRIAQILSKADAAITQTESLIAKYQRIKTGLMQDLLTKGIDEHGNIRSKQTHRFVVKNGMEVPAEWHCSTVGAYLETIEQGWSPDCEGEPAPTGEWGVLKTTSVTWDGYNENENKKLPGKLIPKTQYEIKDGDVLITRGGPNSRVGVVAFVKKTRNKLILCDKIYRLKPKATLLPEFLAIALSGSATQTHLSNLKTGMAESQTNISQKIVESLGIMVPHLNEQKQIIGKLNAIDKTLKQYQVNLSKLQSLKIGLMQDLLDGRVSVKVRLDTSAIHERQLSGD